MGVRAECHAAILKGPGQKLSQFGPDPESDVDSWIFPGKISSQKSRKLDSLSLSRLSREHFVSIAMFARVDSMDRNTLQTFKNRNEANIGAKLHSLLYNTTREAELKREQTYARTKVRMFSVRPAWMLVLNFALLVNS